MASNQTHGYHPIALPDWKELLQSLAAYIVTLEADHPPKASPGLDAKSRSALIGHYIADLEYCLNQANRAINYYEALAGNYDRLVAVMEESRNRAYDAIGQLKAEIDAAMKYRPFGKGD